MRVHRVAMRCAEMKLSSSGSMFHKRGKMADSMRFGEDWQALRPRRSLTATSRWSGIVLVAYSSTRVRNRIEWFWDHLATERVAARISPNVSKSWGMRVVEVDDNGMMTCTEDRARSFAIGDGSCG